MDRRSLNPFKELRLLISLWRLYRLERPALVHHFTIKSVVYGSFAALLAGVPARVNAVTGMGYLFTNNSLKARTLRPIVSCMMRLLLNVGNTRLILQNRDDVKAFTQAKLVRPELIRLIKGSGVDTSRFQSRSEEKPLLHTTTRVVLVARLLWDKGIGEYVEAARLLQARGLKIRLILAGATDPGNPAAIAQETLDFWAKEGVIDLLGHIDDPEALYADAHIAVLPSYREGLPKSLIEAAACGLALVTTDAPGCREVVQHEVNGLLVPLKHPVALANAIQRLHDNPEWARQMGQAAKQSVLQEFDERVVIQKTLLTYDELLS